jgi:pseudouridine kinase
MRNAQERPPAPSGRDRVVCAGNAALDRTFAVHGPVHLATSNPSNVRSSFGGVARNVAENLARLGVDVTLATQVGDDLAGRSLLADCASAGVATRGIAMSSRYPTAEYVAIIDERRELVIGASETNVIDALTVETLAAAFRDDGRMAWTFADCNLPAAVLAAFLAQPRAAEHRLAIDAVSIAKVQRLPHDLHGIDVLFVNEDEARILLGAAAARDVLELAPAIVERGAGAVVLTRGAQGAIVFDGARTALVSAPVSRPVDVTGAGDALIAGTLFGLLHGEPLAAAVRTGTLVALLTIESPTTVSPTLDRAALDAQRARLGALA